VEERATTPPLISQMGAYPSYLWVLGFVGVYGTQSCAHIESSSLSTSGRKL